MIYIYASTVVREIYKIPCKKYLSGSKNEKKRKEIEASAWKVLKISSSNK
jgi:hypothetical protein